MRSRTSLYTHVSVVSGSTEPTYVSGLNRMCSSWVCRVVAQDGRVSACCEHARRARPVPARQMACIPFSGRPAPQTGFGETHSPSLCYSRERRLALGTCTLAGLCLPNDYVHLAPNFCRFFFSLFDSTQTKRCTRSRCAFRGAFRHPAMRRQAKRGPKVFRPSKSSIYDLQW